MPHRLPLRPIAATLIAAGMLFSLFPPHPQSVRATHLCANTGSPFGPFDMQAYEAADYKATYGGALELAGFNQLFPDIPSFALPSLETGDRSADSTQQIAPYIPPVILKSIAWIESGWAQASYDVHYGATGPTLISHDCGYGIMQVTSGMQNISGVPTLDQSMIGGHYAFNIARGAKILADKWNQAPEFRPIVGNRDPHVIENWYYAIWAYNGFASTNHPANTQLFDPNRPPYLCDGTQPRSGYPYQELVFGCVAHPPSRGGVQLWPAQDVHLPDLADPAFSGLASIDRFNDCSYSLQCAGMDIPTPNPNHLDPTIPAVSRDILLGAPSMSLSTGSVSLAAIPGGQSLATTLNITNGGTNLLAWRATSSASWLKISHYEGVSIGSDLGSVSQALNIYADAAGLSPGSQVATISLESLYSAAVPATIQVTLLIDLRAGQITSGDFTGDGRTDVAFLCCKDYASIWTSRGDGSFAANIFRPWPGYATQVGSWGAADFNGDGRDDLIHLCCENYINTWISQGDGTFAVRGFSPWPDYKANVGSWVGGDFNGDGKVDMVHLCCDHYANIWFSRGDGTFDVATARAWPDYTINVGSWQSGDFNGDGKTDLIHFCCRDYVNIWLSNGDGSFSVSSFRPWNDYSVQAGSWLVGQFNNDRRADLVHICCRNYVNTWFSNGDGTFGIARYSPWPDYTADVGFWRASDLNGDGRTELIHACCYDYIHTWFSNGDGSYGVKTFRPWSDYNTQVGSWQIGDYDGDRRWDLLHLCCYYANVWGSQGDGSFSVKMFSP